MKAPIWIESVVTARPVTRGIMGFTTYKRTMEKTKEFTLKIPYGDSFNVEVGSANTLVRTIFHLLVGK